MELTLTDPPGETTPADLKARMSGISASAVHHIRKANGLQTHRYRQFKLSDSKFFIGAWNVGHQTKHEGKGISRDETVQSWCGCPSQEHLGKD